MENDTKLKFMASCGTIITHGALGLLFFSNGVLHHLTGNWFVIPDLLLASANFFVVARLLTSPVLEINGANIRFLRNAVTPTKVVKFEDILDIEKYKKSSFKIILRNRKAIVLPGRWIKKSERDSMLSALHKIEDAALLNPGASSSREGLN